MATVSGNSMRDFIMKIFHLNFLAITLLAAVTVAGETKSPALNTLQARQSPDWLKHGVIYQVWLRSFTPEGTLKAATERLPKVAEFGTSIIYLSPIMLQDDDMRTEFWSPRQQRCGSNNPRNPYRIKDYNKVDPEFGTDEDLRAFVKTAHKLGMHVLQDVVYFHSGPTSVLLEHPEYFKKDKDGKVSTGQWHFPVHDFSNRQLREYFYANMKHWIKNFDMDGFRCDVADMIPLDFWEEARTILEPMKADLVILAEGQRAADQVRAFDVDYGFSWYGTTLSVFHKGQPASAFRKVWEKQAAERPRGSRFMRYTENHDLVNDMQHSEVICSAHGSDAMSVINFTLDGVPMLYNGQEIADVSRQSLYTNWNICWDAACLPQPKATFEFYTKLCRMRQGEKALSDGEVVWLDNDQPDSVVSFMRKSGNESIISVVNISNRKARTQVTLPDGFTVPFNPLLEARSKITTEPDKFICYLQNFGYFVGKSSK